MKAGSLKPGRAPRRERSEQSFRIPLTQAIPHPPRAGTEGCGTDAVSLFAVPPLSLP
jgi:hypothetical protein